MVNTEKLMIQTSDGIQLETESYASSSDPASSVIVCHPHPQFGGSMWNNVVTGVFYGLIKEDISCLRFNFRAVGNSTGEHGAGEEERIDVKSCVDFLIEDKQVERILLCGYSYGAAVSASVVNYCEQIIGFIAVAFPWDFMGSFFKQKSQTQKPKLFIQGTKDNIAHYSKFGKHYEDYDDPKKKVIIDGADHFYGGRENQVAREVIEFYRSLKSW